MPKPILPLALSLIAVPLGAQPDLRQPGSVCWWRTGPAARCRNIVVTEAAVEWPAIATRREMAFDQSPKIYDTRWTVTGGFMTNYSATRALGITLTFDPAADMPQGPARGEIRVRQWRERSATDVSAGIVQLGLGSGFNALGLTAAVGQDRRLIGAGARLNVLRGQGKTMFAGFLDARATGPAGPLAAAIAVTIVGIIIAREGID